MKKPPLTVRPGRPEDEQSIGALLDRIFDDPRPLEQRRRLWKWRYDDNPAKTDAFPGFLVAEQGGEIVGVHGLAPLRMKIGETVLTASCSCDLAADPKARAAGMRIKLAALSPDLSPLHISTSANEPANKITLALGGKEAPGGRRRLIKPLRVSGLLGRALKAKMGALAAVAALVGKPADWLLALGRLGSRPSVPGATVEVLSGFDERFDRLWQRMAGDYPVIMVRDAAYLNWRYAEYPFAGIESIALSKGDEVLGLAVWHRSIDEDGLPFAALLELMTPRGETAVSARLLAEVIRRAGGAGAHYITARTCDSELEALMLRRGFKIREAHYSPVTYKSNTDIPEDVLSGAGNWYMSLGDGDGCYFYD